MKHLKQFLSEIITQELRLAKEAAIKPNQITNLALFVGHEGKNVRCILYDCSVFENFFNKYVEYYEQISNAKINSIKKALNYQTQFLE